MKHDYKALSQQELSSLASAHVLLVEPCQILEVFCQRVSALSKSFISSHNLLYEPHKIFQMCKSFSRMHKQIFQTSVGHLALSLLYKLCMSAWRAAVQWLLHTYFLSQWLSNLYSYQTFKAGWHDERAEWCPASRRGKTSLDLSGKHAQSQSEWWGTHSSQNQRPYC